MEKAHKISVLRNISSNKHFLAKRDSKATYKKIIGEQNNKLFKFSKIHSVFESILECERQFSMWTIVEQNWNIQTLDYEMSM